MILFTCKETKLLTLTVYATVHTRQNNTFDPDLVPLLITKKDTGAKKGGKQKLCQAGGKTSAENKENKQD